MTKLFILIMFFFVLIPVNGIIHQDSLITDLSPLVDGFSISDSDQYLILKTESVIPPSLLNLVIN